MSTHGGKRTGAGRKKGSTKYGEPTQSIRVPESMIPAIKSELQARKEGARLELGELSSVQMPISKPSYQPRSLYAAVAAGFPSPAAEYEEGKLDLNEEFIKSPSSTFFVRVTGDSMIDDGIHPDSILIVDRSLSAAHDRVVIAIVDNELTVKRLYKRRGKVELHAANKKYSPIRFSEGSELEIWGVVTGAIRKF